MIFLGETAYKWWTTEESNPNHPYFREVNESDRENFKGKKIGKGVIYKNAGTNEVSLVNPKKPIKEKKHLSVYRVAQTIFDGAFIGGIASKAVSLIGLFIVRVGYGGLIGSAIGAIKLYVDHVRHTRTPKNFILCFNGEILDELDKRNREINLRLHETSQDEIDIYNEKVEDLIGPMRDEINHDKNLSPIKRSNLIMEIEKIANAFLIELSELQSSSDQDDSKEREMI